jgi:hypothetical protein
MFKLIKQLNGLNKEHDEKQKEFNDYSKSYQEDKSQLYLLIHLKMKKIARSMRNEFQDLYPYVNIKNCTFENGFCITSTKEETDKIIEDIETQSYKSRLSVNEHADNSIKIFIKKNLKISVLTKNKIYKIKINNEHKFYNIYKMIKKYKKGVNMILSDRYK